MAYTEVLHETGDYLRVHIHPCYRKGEQRGIRKRATTAAQKYLNDRNAKNRFTDTVHLNFTASDIAVRLDYQKFLKRNRRNPTPEEAKRIMRNYLLRLKRIYAACGRELKYIYVTEIGKVGGNVHHHLIVNGISDRDSIEQCWTEGYGNTRRLQFSEKGVAGLAHYMSKDPMTKKMWYGSRNLIKPTAEGKHPNIRSNSYRLTARQVHYVYNNPDDTNEIRKLYPGYEVAEVECSNMVDEETGEVFPNPYGIFITLYLYRSDTKLFCRA